MDKNTEDSLTAEQWLDPPTEPLSQPGESRFAPTWFAAPGTPDPDRNSQLAAQVRLPSVLWQQLMRARVVVATVLLLLQVFIITHGGKQIWPLGVCLAYQVATAAVLRWVRPSQSDSIWSPRWALTLWMDLSVFAVLHLLQGGINFTLLFALPVLLAAILGPLLLALGSAAAATLVLLFDAWQNSHALPSLDTNLYLQASLTGVGFFLVALLANQLALRLIREQAQALRSQVLARTESEISTLIVNGLNEGVLVLSAHGHVWHANPAVCTMLDAENDTASALQRTPGWPLLATWLQSCQMLGRDAETELVLPTRIGDNRKLRVRARLVLPQARQRMEQACVVFLEDLRDVEARIQTEKLAAMGRLSAAVAHEIRNPLAAIAQANALLAEDSTDPDQQRLVTMIGQNAKRLGRTVDDILNVVRASIPNHLEPRPHLLLDSATKHALADWLQLHPQGSRLESTLGTADVSVVFDAEHFQRVLVNLLDNAHRHASTTNGAIRVYTTVDESGPRLTVWSQGAELPASVRQHLFEPFASSNSRSSGLGLYLSQELCARHDARLRYHRLEIDQRGGNAFTVSFTSTPNSGTLATYSH